jgi:group II intron reverse transcriptase/maturase
MNEYERLCAFQTTLEAIVSVDKLKTALGALTSKAVGLDRVTKEDFGETDLGALSVSVASETYTPEPLKRVVIPKPNSNETRPIAVASLKDRVVERALHSALNAHFDPQFSDRNYGYRPARDAERAVGRVVDSLNRGDRFFFKADIENFFEAILHVKLIERLNALITDGRIVRLIILFAKNGAFERRDYITHEIGVHQGGILSPFLSNLYLDPMDKYIENLGVNHIRFADDFLLTSSSKETLETASKALRIFLEKLGLKLNADKSKTGHIREGFASRTAQRQSGRSPRSLGARPARHVLRLRRSASRNNRPDHSGRDLLHRICHVEQSETSSEVKRSDI